jgi:hypothetical protein
MGSVKSKRDNANAVAKKTNDESWATIMDADDACDKGKSYNTLSALTDNAALTSKPEVELYGSGPSTHVTLLPSFHQPPLHRTLSQQPKAVFSMPSVPAI